MKSYVDEKGERWYYVGRKPVEPKESKTLRAIANKDPRISEYSFEGADGHWLYLHPGHNFDGCHAVHEYTVTQARSALGRVEACEPGCDCHWDTKGE